MGKSRFLRELEAWLLGDTDVAQRWGPPPSRRGGWIAGRLDLSDSWDIDRLLLGLRPLRPGWALGSARSISGLWFVGRSPDPARNSASSFGRTRDTDRRPAGCDPRGGEPCAE